VLQRLQVEYKEYHESVRTIVLLVPVWTQIRMQYCSVLQILVDTTPRQLKQKVVALQSYRFICLDDHDLYMSVTSHISLQRQFANVCSITKRKHNLPFLSNRVLLASS
jgi:hypothetical protein